MTVSCKLYGHHNPTRDICRQCDPVIVAYCKEAGDPTLKVDSCIPLHEIDYAATPANEETIDPKDRRHGDMGAILAEFLWCLLEHPGQEGEALDLLVSLRDMAHRQPKRFRAVARKILQPEKYYSEIGDEMGGMSRQLVAHHIKKAILDLPAVSQGLLIDPRFNKNRDFAQKCPMSLNALVYRDFRGKLLKRARILAKMTQTVLGQRVGVSATAICRYENDHLMPSYDTFLRIKETLKL